MKKINLECSLGTITVLSNVLWANKYLKTAFLYKEIKIIEIYHMVYYNVE